MELRGTSSPADRAKMSHESYSEIEGSRYDRSIHGVGTKSTAMMRPDWIDVHTHDFRRRQIEADAHVLHAWMLVPSSREGRPLGIRERGTDRCWSHVGTSLIGSNALRFVLAMHA